MITVLTYWPQMNSVEHSMEEAGPLRARDAVDIVPGAVAAVLLRMTDSMSNQEFDHTAGTWLRACCFKEQFQPLDL